VISFCVRDWNGNPFLLRRKPFDCTLGDKKDWSGKPDPKGNAKIASFLAMTLSKNFF
jgi:hypothetical protein